MTAPACDGKCCRNPWGACYCRHGCAFHERETLATLTHKTMYRDPTGTLASQRADRARRTKQRKP